MWLVGSLPVLWEWVQERIDQERIEKSLGKTALSGGGMGFPDNYTLWVSSIFT